MNDKSEPKEILIDGFAGAALIGGLIRIDMIKLVPNPSDPNKPQTKVAYRLIASPQAFLQASSVMNELTKKLKESGILQPAKGDAGDKGKK
ncbi:hypothetical protein [Candidiatus Paracoxiella cheracis]|uniref:hypothetical protein n=1 Tax=Candidiatus Paracoxiella cheracis TaxID=3405120 RepID=UPI003BF5C612